MCETLNETCICVRLIPSQRMIEVRDVKAQLQLRGKLKQQMEQTKRVSPTRNANNHCIAGLQECMPMNVGGNTQDERTHGGMIACRERSYKGPRYFRGTFGHPGAGCYNSDSAPVRSFARN